MMNFDVIYSNYYFLIQNVLAHLNLNNHHSSYLDSDDFYQIACIALWESVLTYPKELSDNVSESFCKYSFTFMKHRLIDALRSFHTHYKDLPASTDMPPWELIIDTKIDPLNDIQTYQDILSSLSTPLTKKQYQYIILHFHYGWCLTDIAAYYHVTRQTVFQWQQGALKKIKNYFTLSTDIHH